MLYCMVITDRYKYPLQATSVIPKGHGKISMSENNSQFGIKTITPLFKGVNTPVKNGGKAAAAKVVFVVGNHDEANLCRPEAGVYALNLSTGGLDLRSQFPIGKIRPKRDTQYPAYNWAGASMLLDSNKAYAISSISKDIVGKGALRLLNPEELAKGFIESTIGEFKTLWLHEVTNETEGEGVMELTVGGIKSLISHSVDHFTKHAEHNLCNGNSEAMRLCVEVRNKMRAYLEALEYGLPQELVSRHDVYFGHTFHAIPGMERLSDLMSNFSCIINHGQPDQKVGVTFHEQKLFTGNHEVPAGILPMVVGPSTIVYKGAMPLNGRGFPKTLV